jgi:hypothetical protein
MRVEMIPVLLGMLVIVVGGAVAADAWGDPERGPMRERRRRIRTAIDRLGEQMAGVGVLLLGAALISRDLWRFGAPTALIGTVLVVWGGIRNRDYIKERLFFRGVARRGTEQSIAEQPRLRIR